MLPLDFLRRCIYSCARRASSTVASVKSPQQSLFKRPLRGALALTAGTGLAYKGYEIYQDSCDEAKATAVSKSHPTPINYNFPSREALFSRLNACSDKDFAEKTDSDFDVLVIGGGATGCGIAVDAATRGLKVALVERDDFAAGTSSRSTKLVHGGVRYLEKAFHELDVEHLKLVIGALRERAAFLKVAPHIAHPVPILLPLYSHIMLPYYWAGCKAYDVLAGRHGLISSRLVSPTAAQEMFPLLKTEGLAGALVYYDGQHNDSRMNIALALTAISHGATVLNHASVIEILVDSEKSSIKNESDNKNRLDASKENASTKGKANDSDQKNRRSMGGARIVDLVTGKEHVIRAKVVVNAGGPFADGIRKLTNGEASKKTDSLTDHESYAKAKKDSSSLLENKVTKKSDVSCGNPNDIVTPSSGVHVVLPAYIAQAATGGGTGPGRVGLLDPKTSDGRMLFLLPWENVTIAGTTDTPVAKADSMPYASEDEIEYILKEVRNYLSPEAARLLRREDVLASWSGYRPLAKLPTASIKKDTTLSDGTVQKKSLSSLVRSHLVHVDPDSRLISVVGGKWTMYRAMAEDAVNEVQKQLEEIQMREKLQGQIGSSNDIESKSVSRKTRNYKDFTTPCVTPYLQLYGAAGYNSTFFIELLQSNKDIDEEMARHLAASYGGEAKRVVALAKDPQSKSIQNTALKRLAPEMPYIEAEVVHAVQREYACTAVDVLARRTRLAFMNVKAAEKALPRVVEIMGAELDWNAAKKEQEMKDARNFLVTMGLST